MKRILLSVAILAVAASCSKNEVVETPQQNMIGFSTINDRVSKAANDSADDYTVFSAVKTSADTYSDKWYISQATVSTSEDGVDTANGTYYWPLDGNQTLDFFAVSPAFGAIVNQAGAFESATPSLPIQYIVADNGEVDFTVATPVTGAFCNKNEAGATSGTVETSGQVALQFKHMLTKSTLSIKLDAALAADYEMSFGDVMLFPASSKIQLDMAKSPITPTYINIGKPLYYLFTNYGGPATSTSNDMTTAGSMFISDAPAMFVPHNNEACRFMICDLILKHKETGVVIYASDTINVNLTNATFEAGKAYNFILTVSADMLDLIEITFDSEVLEDWNTPAIDAAIPQPTV